MMTNTKPHPIKAANKTLKKIDPFATLKSSIMMVSIAGTMAGWLLLLDQETDSSVVNITILSIAVPKNDEMVIESMPIVDINQLRQVNEIAPVEDITVVARTRSSQ